MFYYALKMLYYASICYYAFRVYYAQNYASRIRQGLAELHADHIRVHNAKCKVQVATSLAVQSYKLAVEVFKAKLEVCRAELEVSGEYQKGWFT